MPAYLVTYDLNRETSRPNITKKLKDSYPAWAMLSESSYAIVTSSTPGEVYATLKPMIDADDNIYIITLKKPYSGYGSKLVNDWLENNLPY